LSLFFFLIFHFHFFCYKQIRENFGGRLKLAISGGAALSDEVQDFFNKIGICLLEGYGLTEVKNKQTNMN